MSEKKMGSCERGLLPNEGGAVRDDHLVAYVVQMTELLGLTIPPEQLPGVVENFGQVQRIAQLV